MKQDICLYHLLFHAFDDYTILLFLVLIFATFDRRECKSVKMLLSAGRCVRQKETICDGTQLTRLDVYLESSLVRCRIRKFRKANKSYDML